MEAYPLGDLALLHCSGDVDGIEEAAELKGASLSVVERSFNSGEATFLLRDTIDDGEFLSDLEGSQAHILPPIRWRGGEAVVTLLCEDDVDLGALRERLPEARLLSKRRPSAKAGHASAFTSPLFLPKLTEKQARALLVAHERGYYDFPRRATTEELSLSIGIARSTFQQHLNRAEDHVMRAMLPMVRMRAGQSPGGALEVYSRFSRELGLYVQLEMLGDRVAGVHLSRKASPRAGSDHPYLARILEQVRTGEGDLRDIPLHLEVGPFEREVLEFLRTIPPGETITYGEIARRLGHPGASRAVGSACAKNPALIVIPCHRVVPKAGGLGGYSGEGGPETKRKLLEREGSPLGRTRRRSPGP